MHVLHNIHWRIQRRVWDLDPPPSEKSQKYRVFWKPEKSQGYQASIQCWATIGPQAKRHLNGVSLMGRSWPAFSGIWILSPHFNLKKVSELDPL